VQAFSPFSPSSAYSSSTNGGAAYLDGSGNYLSLATNAAFNITSGSTDSFICEFWVNWSTVAANMSIVDNGGLNSVSFANWSITLNASSQITLNWASSGAPGSTIGTLPTSIVPVVGQWYHIAFVKTNADWAVFVNGTRATNYSGLNTASKTSATALYIGYGIATSAAGNPFKGYISNVRIYKGATASAPYSATSTTITVPTAPVTAITNTSLLTNFTNGSIVDAHSSNVLETVGNAKLSTSVTKFGTASMAFDGTGDSLKIPDNSVINLFAGDFTLECWAYFNEVNAEMCLINKGWQSASAYASYCIYMASGGSLKFLSSSNGSSWNIANEKVIGTMTTTTWTHIAVTRSGTTFRAFVNGVINDAFTFTSSASLANLPAQTLFIGGRTDGSSTLNGYLEDVRITRGFARYTANFTPPTTGFLGQ